MKVFHCDQCEQLVFFENTHCTNCDCGLGYVPETAQLAALPSDKDSLTLPVDGEDVTYRRCQNYSAESVCNWLVKSENNNLYCHSCRLTRKIPDLSVAGNRDLWYRLEAAKRRLIYTLLKLNLPLVSKSTAPEQGLAFEFLADLPGSPVLTGHDFGVITVNLAEANDAEREMRRMRMHEPYRTLLGHFRHEVGHYYWDVLIKDSEHLDEYRRLFGDERENYDEALQRHYAQGAPADWQASFISEYATSHPWEDWAETWAHYLHMIDTLETAVDCGMSLKPRRSDEPQLKPHRGLTDGPTVDFGQLVESWHPVTYILNNLNRGLGLQDGYPFVLSDPVIGKLRFVHELVAISQTRKLQLEPVS